MPLLRNLSAPLFAVALLASPMAVQAAGSDDNSSSGGWSNSSQPANPDWQKAVTAIKDGQYAVALPKLRKVVAKDPQNADAWNYIGFSLRKMGQFKEAHVAYDKALKIKPEHLGALEYLGELYLQENNLKMAEVQLKKLDAACFFGCNEYRELKSRIAAFKNKGS